MKHIIILPIFLFSQTALADQSAKCLQQKVILQNAKINSEFGVESLSFDITNNLKWPISGINLRVVVREEGRSVPWGEIENPTSIPGGVEPNETRKVSGFYVPSSTESKNPLNVELTVLDVADDQKRLLIGDIQVISWNKEPSPYSCD